MAFDLAQRYQSIDDFMADLTQPNVQFFSAHPLVHEHQSKLRLWQFLCAFWFAITLAIVVYFIIH